MKVTVPRVLVVLTGALLLTYTALISVRTGTEERGRNASAGRAETSAPSVSAPRARKLFPPAGKMFVGVATHDGPSDFTAVNMFTAAAKHQPQVMLFTAGWANNTFDRTDFDRISTRGMLPMLAWEPWDYRLDEAARRQGRDQPEIDAIRSNQPDYRLSRIAAGDFDSYLLSWAEGIKSLGYPVAIRFAHEMNGWWYPWSETVNGNRPGDYIKAWRHVHGLFKAAGVTNATWVWSPNASWDDSTPKVSTLYPGDDYVDWVGLSGYYGTGAFSGYRSFDAIFKSTVEEIRAFSDKPLVITETAAADNEGRKAEWIRETFQVLPSYKRLIGLIWFEVNKERDWRIVSSPAVANAFAREVAAPRYDFSWSPSMSPRTDIEE